MAFATVAQFIRAGGNIGHFVPTLADDGVTGKLFEDVSVHNLFTRLGFDPGHCDNCREDKRIREVFGCCGYDCDRWGFECSLPFLTKMIRIPGALVPPCFSAILALLTEAVAV